MNNFWNETIWKGINDEVRKVAGTVRVAQKVFPTVILDNPSDIPDDKIDLTNFSIQEGSTKAFVEIAVPFSTTPNQVAHEATLQTGLKLARLDAAVVGFIEDLIVFQGNVPPPKTPPNILVRNGGSAGNGLLGIATPTTGYTPPNVPIIVKPLDPKKPGVYGQNTFNGVVQAISELNQNSQAGPFGLFLENSVFADTYAAVAPSFIITADRITPLVTGGFVGTAALPPKTGLLASLGGEPTTLYVGTDVTTEFTLRDQAGSYFFRVYERFQFNARDSRAFVRLDFQ
jgi:Encapsulating protein for peroxidase